MIFQYNMTNRKIFTDPVLQWCRSNARKFTCRRRYRYITSYTFELTEEDMVVLRIMFDLPISTDIRTKPTTRKAYPA